MTINTTSGSKFYIGGTTASDTQTEFEALTWTEVGEVENFGEFGDESSVVTFAAVGDARVRKLKGARDAGTLVLVVGRDAADAGQDALKAAELTKYDYNFKVEIADKSSGGTNSVQYFRGMVMSKRDNLGANDNVVRTTFNIAINTAILEVEGS